MSKIFIFGSHPQLSLAELISLYPQQSLGAFYLPDIYKIKGDFFDNLDCQSLLDSLGGTIKIARLIKKIDSYDYNLIYSLVKDELLQSSKNKASKFVFALSYYNFQKLDFKFGLSLKKELISQGINSRLVVSKDRELSSVVIRQNKVLEKGTEIMIISDGQSVLIAKTEAVQDFKELSKRDYGRPARDDFSGMLPPKLARIMVNLAGLAERDKRLLDPFCGSGTILTEAALAGYKHLIGADISSQAINDSKENFYWTKDRYNLDKIDIRFINRHIGNLAKVVKEKSIDLIITEPYLGPQRGLNNIPAIKAELEDLYGQAFDQFAKVLTDSGKIIMVWPIFFQKIFLEPNFSPFKIISPIKNLTNLQASFNLSSRHTLIYGRPGQKVWREIVMLTRK